MVKRSRFFAAAVVTALALSCGGDGPTSSDSNVVKTLFIQGDSVDTLDAFGPHQLRYIGINANRVQVAPESYVTHWRSLDPTVASVGADGLVNVLHNGTARVVATAFQASDTVTLVVIQRATRLIVEQDTIVALVSGATRLSGVAIGSDTMRFIASAVDANGNVAPRLVPITWTVGAGVQLSIRPNSGGDTVAIIGSTPGTGSVTGQFGAFSVSVPVQVVAQYSVARIVTTAGGTVVSPNPIAVPQGTAVVFLNGDPDGQKAEGTNWRTGLIPGMSKEAQLFTQSGTLNYRAGSFQGSIIVNP
ncbi:MAG: Ig-like domain-containing protein [Gemmatimonadaceae bacterium]